MEREQFGKTKIIGTIGPASRDKSTIRQLITEGLDIIRINSAHGTRDQHQKIIRAVRSLEEELQIPLTILYDLAGPKLRLGELPEGGVKLESGSEIEIEEASGKSSTRLPVECKNIPAIISPGDRIYINDGFVQLTVKEVRRDYIRAQVDMGGLVTTHKGVNLPGVEIDLPALSDEDHTNLRFALRNEVDWIALSFVRKPGDIAEVNSVMEEVGSLCPVIAKIETSQAVETIDGIVAAFQGCMVARGDLGVEIPIQDVPHLQKQIIGKCNRAGKPVITATQMLESMVHSSRPTRAEAADVANAIYDGTDCVMLSGETAIGEYPVRAVRVMNDIILATEEQIDYTADPAAFEGTKTIADSVSHSVFQAAIEVKASAIVTMTHSGSTARMVSKYRPPVPIYALTPFQRIQRQLNLSWGVSPLLGTRNESTDAMFVEAENILRKLGIVENGDKLVLSAGVPIGVPGTTNLMKVLVVG
ncbi:MAG TPA: pyruvate kinase [bacterium]|nr:pyruvate kinase [bacterium]